MWLGGHADAPDKNCMFQRCGVVALNQILIKERKNMMKKGTKSLVLIALLVVVGSVAIGQESLKEIVTAEGIGWLAGRWKATTDEGQDILLGYRWAANGHAVVSENVDVGLQLIGHDRVHGGSECRILLGCDGERRTREEDGKRAGARTAEMRRAFHGCRSWSKMRRKARRRVWPR